MCTAITYKTEDFYFGRNLDLEYSYNETITVTPRNFPFHFRNRQTLSRHYAMIGMATIAEKYPLYYEATNEKGLSIAGLNFPGNAVYHPANKNMINLAPYELIPWLLGQYESVSQVRSALNGINLWDFPFSQQFPLTPLHWIISDNATALTLEVTVTGMHVYDNPVGVLTNNPPFDYHMYNMSNHINLSPDPPVNRFSSKIAIEPYSLGMGSIGLPGDPSSASRFIRAAFTKLNSILPNTELESVGQFFHILSSVAQQKGITVLNNRKLEYTQYSCCCNTVKGIYYYTTYNNAQISAVNMHNTDMESDQLSAYPPVNSQNIFWHN